MHRFKAPVKPPSFDADMRKHYKSAAKSIKAGRCPTFSDVWKNHKAAFRLPAYKVCIL